MTPDSLAPGRQRRAWRALSAMALLLAATSILLTAVKWTNTDTRQDRQSVIAERAICAIITYAEDNAELARTGDPNGHPPRPPNPKAADNLEQLAQTMRSTGIACPSRRQQR